MALIRAGCLHFLLRKELPHLPKFPTACIWNQFATPEFNLNQKQQFAQVYRQLEKGRKTVECGSCHHRLDKKKPRRGIHTVTDSEQKGSLSFQEKLQSLDQKELVLEYGLENASNADDWGVLLQTYVGQPHRAQQNRIKKLVDNGNFNLLCQKLCINSSQMSLPALLGTLHSLLRAQSVLRIPDAQHILRQTIINVRNVVLQYSDIMSFNDLCETLRILEGPNTEIAQKYIQPKLQRKLNGTTDPQFLAKLYAQESESTILHKTVGKSIWRFHNSMTLEEKFNVTCVLAKSRKLDRELVCDLMKTLNRNKMNFAQTIRCLEIIHEISRFDPDVNPEDTNQIASFVKRATTLVLAFTSAEELSASAELLLRTCMVLRWRDPATLEALADCLLARRNEVNLLTLATLVQATSFLNYQPKALGEELAAIVREVVQLRKRWTRVSVFCALNLFEMKCFDYPIARQMLDDDFTGLLQEQIAGRTLTAAQTAVPLLKLDALVPLDIKKYEGPRLSTEFKLKYDLKPRERSYLKDVQDLMSAVSSLVPSPDYVKYQVEIPFWSYIIDVEMLVDSKGNALPITQYKSPLSEDDEGKEIHPKFHRLAIRLLTFKDLTRNTVMPLGPNASVFRYLGHLGYTVVPINFPALRQAKSKTEKTQFMRRALMRAIG